MWENAGLRMLEGNRGNRQVHRSEETGMGHALAMQSSSNARHCQECWYDLSGLPAKGGTGRCPECGTSFNVKPNRRRHVDDKLPASAHWREWWERVRPAAWTAAVLFLTLGCAALLILFGVAAYSKLERKLNPPEYCYFGP